LNCTTMQGLITLKNTFLEKKDTAILIEEHKNFT
jgi:hypothetical protein